MRIASHRNRMLSACCGPRFIVAGDDATGAPKNGGGPSIVRTSCQKKTLHVVRVVEANVLHGARGPIRVAVVDVRQVVIVRPRELIEFVVRVPGGSETTRA